METRITHLSKAFIKGIEEKGFEPEEVINNWTYDPNFTEVEWEDDIKCICGTHITKVHKIRYENDELIIGKDCAKSFIKSFVEVKKKKSCDGCGGHHRNRKDNFCNACRAKNEEEKKMIKIKIEEDKASQCACGKKKKPEFKRCYVCNNENKTNQCACGCAIEPQYNKCYKCQRNEYSDFIETYAE